LNGTHPITKPLIKLRKLSKLRSGVILCYPDLNLPYHLYTDASNHHLGAVIMQDKKPAAFYSRNFNIAQERYTTTEGELLSNIISCKECKNILLGYY
jgi:hypothetical protein